MKPLGMSKIRNSGLTQNNWLMGLIGLVFVVNIVITIVLVSQLRSTSLPVPIRFTTLTNFDQLGAWQSLYIIPVLMWVFSVVNILIAHTIYHRSRITSFMVVIASFGYGLLALQMVWLYLGVTNGAH